MSKHASDPFKGGTTILFHPGDWIPFGPEFIPNNKKAQQGYDPFKAFGRITANAKAFELQGKYNKSHSFKVSNLAPFDAGDPVLRSKPSQEGGNDEDIQSLHAPQGEARDPFVPDFIMMQPRSKGTQHKVRVNVEKLMEQLEHVDKAQDSALQVLARRPFRVELNGHPWLKLYPNEEDNQANQLALLEDIQETIEDLESSLKDQKINGFKTDQFGPNLPGLLDKLVKASNPSQTSFYHDPGEYQHSKILIMVKAAGETQGEVPNQAQEDPWPFEAQQGKFDYKFGYNLPPTCFGDYGRDLKTPKEPETLKYVLWLDWIAKEIT